MKLSSAWTSPVPYAVALSAGLLLSSSNNAADKDVVPAELGSRARGMETQEDLPGDYHKYYGQRYNGYRDEERKMAKIDLDGDFNYDGTIDNHDPADNGAFQQTPPGLVVGVGETSKLIVRIRPYRVDFKGDAVFTLEVGGINRADKSGLFSSIDEEISACGHIRVWRDSTKRELMLDSSASDESLRRKEWKVSSLQYPANLPNEMPRTVYVEGIKPSGQYAGDIRLLLTVSHGGRGEKVLKRFRTSFDHILMTVDETAHRKEYINNNAEGVWLQGRPSTGGGK